MENQESESLKNRLLEQLQQFRGSPTSVIPYLTQRLQRYVWFEGCEYLFSHKYKKKAIQIQQAERSSARIQQLIGTLSKVPSSMEPLQPMPQLDELANKICQAALEETWGQFEQERKRILRATLEEDTQYCYPTSVVCLLSLGFDEPYESLLNLLIDEGVRNRSNRTALFNRTLRYVGLASEQHPSDPQLRCVVYVLTDQVIARLSSSNSPQTMVSGRQNSDTPQKNRFNSGGNIEGDDTPRSRQENKAEYVADEVKRRMNDSFDFPMTAVNPYSFIKNPGKYEEGIISIEDQNHHQKYPHPYDAQLTRHSVSVNKVTMGNQLPFPDYNPSDPLPTQSSLSRSSSLYSQDEAEVDDQNYPKTNNSKVRENQQTRNSSNRSKNGKTNCVMVPQQNPKPKLPINSAMNHKYCWSGYQWRQSVARPPPLANLNGQF